uniref:Uncharacterized protein n=1 Tax=Photinus pyralis TaxID=7054 RepID=A0A1Y1MSB3_PHOPY
MAYTTFVFLVISCVYIHANKEEPIVLWYPIPIDSQQLQALAHRANATECHKQILQLIAPTAAPPLHFNDSHIIPTTLRTRPKSNELGMRILSPSGSEESSQQHAINGSAAPDIKLRFADDHAAIPTPATETHTPIKLESDRAYNITERSPTRIDLEKVVRNYLRDPEHKSNCTNILRQVLGQLKELASITYLSTDSSRSSQLQQHAKI